MAKKHFDDVCCLASRLHSKRISYLKWFNGYSEPFKTYHVLDHCRVFVRLSTWIVLEELNTSEEEIQYLRSTKRWGSLADVCTV